MVKAVLFDWGNTLMVDGGRYGGAMCDWPSVEACPHVSPVLRELASDYLLCLATNADDSREEEIRAALKRVRLNKHIRRVFCSNQIGARKPSPEFFWSILRDLGLPPGQVVMVGDGLENDVRGALRCGLHALWYRAGRREDPEPEGVVPFDDFVALPGLIRAIG